MRLFRKKDDGRSQNGSPAPSDNPYAQSASANPYSQNVSANPYAQGGNPYANVPQGGNPYASAPQGGNPYSSASQNSNGRDDRAETGKFAANNFGASSGYGSNMYNAGESNNNQQRSRYGAGGYGGLAGRDPYNKQDDPNRNALFGGASERAAQSKAAATSAPYDSGNTAGDFSGGGGAAGAGGAGGYSGGYSGGYGSSSTTNRWNTGPTYDDRQLTAEEEEEERIQATKQDIRAVKQKDVAATRNALRLAQQAEEVGRDTLARLGMQSDMIHTTAHNLDLAHNQNKQAEDKARELKTLNRSMFAVHVGNPFTAGARDAKRDQLARDRHEEEKLERESTRRAQFLSNQRMEDNFKTLDKTKQQQEQCPDQRQKNLAERSKYQFEADSEDEEMENEIDSNLNALGGVIKNIRLGAIAVGQEVTIQNQELDRIHQKSDKVDVGITTNTARLNRIH